MDEAMELRKQPHLDISGETDAPVSRRPDRTLVMAIGGLVVVVLVTIYLVWGRAASGPATSVAEGHGQPGQAETAPAHGGSLRVEVNPAGAEVAVEGVDSRQHAPAQFDALPIGVRRRITVTHPGYSPWVGVVVLEAGKPPLRLRVALKPR
jgi:hypothetical protein